MSTTPQMPADKPGLAPPGENDIHFSDWQVLGERTLTCLTCPQQPYYTTAHAFNAHLDACHPLPRRLLCDSQGFVCGHRQMRGH